MESLCIMPALSESRSSSPTSLPAPIGFSDHETRFLQDWDADIKRSASSNACLARLTDGEDEDLAQEARIRLVRAYRNQKTLTPNYLRVLIKNSMLSCRERMRRTYSKAHKKDKKESSAFVNEGIDYLDDDLSQSLIECEETEAEAENSDFFNRPFRRASHHQITLGLGLQECFMVQRWANQLPDRLRRVYEALYVNEMTQRETADRMGVSQPRIAELHRLLLQKAKAELGI